jgi:uncharacterized membrane protein
VEDLIKQFASSVALGLEAAAVLIIAIGAAVALIGSLSPPYGVRGPFLEKKLVYLRFGMWLLLGLEFELASDIIRSVIAPTWMDLGKLGAIAFIRTFLNFFLERDLEKYDDEGRVTGAGRPVKDAAAPGT